MHFVCLHFCVFRLFFIYDVVYVMNGMTMTMMVVVMIIMTHLA